MDIQVISRKSEGVERRLEISVSAERVATEKDKAARRVAKQVKIPGFRPGKVPTNVVKKQFAQAIEQETLDALMREAYAAAIEQEKLEPITQPHAHDVKFEDGKPLTFELHCEVKPVLELARLEGFKVTRPNPAVTEEAFNEQIEQMREQRATWTPVEDKPIEGEMGSVTLAMAGDDGIVPEGKEYRIVLGAGQAIPPIEEVIMELAPGGQVERSVKWPDDFPDESERGKRRETIHFNQLDFSLWTTDENSGHGRNEMRTARRLCVEQIRSRTSCRRIMPQIPHRADRFASGDRLWRRRRPRQRLAFDAGD